MDPDVYNLETMLTDVRYAIRQLMMIDPEVIRALDALERVEERLVTTMKDEAKARGTEWAGSSGGK